MATTHTTPTREEVLLALDELAEGFPNNYHGFTAIEVRNTLSHLHPYTTWKIVREVLNGLVDSGEVHAVRATDDDGYRVLHYRRRGT